MTSFASLDDVRAAAGRDLGASDWVDVEQRQIDEFDRAVGSSDARGYLAVALTNRFLPGLLDVQGASLGVNYGTGAIRFGPSVEAGMRIRARATLEAVDEVPGGIQTTVLVTVEAEGTDEAICTVESLSRYLS